MSQHTPHHTFKPVADIVLSNDIAGLAARAGALADLGARLSRVLPSALSAQVRFADLREGRLVFLASSAAWATRLRYTQALVLEAARQLGLGASELVVKVAPPAPASQPLAPARPLSESAARHLDLAAKLLR
ncbi:hypothetical protein EDC25_12631 [Pseudofulvimonas gallinarii]|uniref:DUF721 domain-containing protein n=2 Tax=Pseudofulvimonas gallinarii TaxID=634155 RepID=A0A4R3L4N5_9GAMM|nr:hypothetical protein EDC25_12631 [Pseudofulvimonas gallinarii]